MNTNKLFTMNFLTKKWFLVLILFNISGILSGQVSQTEFDALTDLYTSTNGANWTNNSGWNTSTNDVGNHWYGITVENGHVTKIYLQDNNLSGSIPVSIGDLGLLSELDLSINSLSGPLPASIGNLTSMTHMYIFLANLTGTIPSSIGNLVNLLELHLDKNDFTGTIPSEFGNLVNMSVLYLDHNQLSGEIPAEFWNLTNLSELYLSFNEISGNLPSMIGDLSKLTYLGMYGNNLSGTVPKEIGNLTLLEELLLGGNALSGELPVEMGNLTNLKICFINENSFSGDVPSTFSNLTSLEALYLGDNQLTGLPDLSGLNFPLTVHQKYNTILALYVRNNNLDFGDLEANIIHMPEDTLYVPQGRITPVQNAYSVSVGNPLDLTISTSGENNQYQWFRDGTPVSALSTSPDFSINNVAEADSGTYRCEISNTLVTGLNLTSEDIFVSVSSGSDGNVPHSEWQALVALFNSTNGENWTDNSGWNTTENTLGVEDWFGITIENGHVTEIFLKNNKLNGIIPYQIGDLPFLTTLNLAKNDISGIIPPEISSLQDLLELQLYSNEMTGEIPGELINIPGLRIIRLFDNQLTGEIPAELGNLSSLVVLELTRNQLTGTIPEQIGNLSDLYAFTVDENQLTGDVPESLSNLTNLGFLYLNDNRFTSIPDFSAIPFPFTPSAFDGIDYYQTLDVSNNQLTFGDLETNISVLPHDSLYIPQEKVSPAQDTFSLLEGDTLSLTIQIDGENNQYQWFKGGSQFSTVSSAPEFSIAGVTIEDAGTYYCEITNILIPGLTIASAYIVVSVERTGVPDSEWQALVALYNATDGDNWIKNNGWDTTVNSVAS
jgi:Leucine-rich repeat (LRR) protein